MLNVIQLKTVVMLCAVTEMPRELISIYIIYDINFTDIHAFLMVTIGVSLLEIDLHVWF